MKEEDKFDEIVSDALKKGAPFELPHDFADRVVMMIQQKSVQQESKKDRWLLIGGIVSMIGVLAFVFTKVDFKPSVGVFTFFQGYWGLVIFGVLFVTALHIIDKRLFKKQESG